MHQRSYDIGGALYVFLGHLVCWSHFGKNLEAAESRHVHENPAKGIAVNFSQSSVSTWLSSKSHGRILPTMRGDDSWQHGGEGHGLPPVGIEHEIAEGAPAKWIECFGVSI